MWRLITSRRDLQAAAIMGVLLVVALWPEATEVEVGSVTRGALAVTIDGEGETRVHHRFIVSAPVASPSRRRPHATLSLLFRTDLQTSRCQSPTR